MAGMHAPDRSATRYLLAPWWIAQLATGAKAFSDNPLLASRALNERGLHVARLKLAHRLAAWRRSRLAALIAGDDVEAFERDGYVEKRDFLPPALFEALRAALFARRAPAREMIQGDAVTRRFAVDPAALADVPGLRELVRNPRWRGLIRYVGGFDAEPLIYIQTILARRHRAAPDPQTRLHRDTFHPSVKAWLFLTDVAGDEGPFRYVPGSHRLTADRLRWEHARSLVAPALDRLSSRGSFRIDEAELPGLGLPPPRANADRPHAPYSQSSPFKPLATLPSTPTKTGPNGILTPAMPSTKPPSGQPDCGMQLVESGPRLSLSKS